MEIERDGSNLIQYQLKLRMTKQQERTCEEWLFHLASVYNFAVRKIELNANNSIYFSRMDFCNLLSGHSRRLGIPSHVLQGVLSIVHGAWGRHFKKLAGKPRLKSKRNQMIGIPFPDPIRDPVGNRITVLGLGSIRFHKMNLPKGRIKCSRIVKRSSGWHLCLCIDAEPKLIARKGEGKIGIDPGFMSLLTTSTGDVIEHPREYEALEKRLGQAQRGRDIRLIGRLNERIANRRKDRNHKLSHKLVAENITIAFSLDKSAEISKRFGKSVSSSGHSQLRQMLAYKSPKSGTQYVEVDPKYSTMTCNVCGDRTGPRGLAGLSVRQWACSGCGTSHDRDVNAAINTLKAAAGYAVEGYAHA